MTLVTTVVSRTVYLHCIQNRSVRCYNRSNHRQDAWIVCYVCTLWLRVLVYTTDESRSERRPRPSRVVQHISEKNFDILMPKRFPFIFFTIWQRKVTMNFYRQDEFIVSIQQRQQQRSCTHSRGTVDNNQVAIVDIVVANHLHCCCRCRSFVLDDDIQNLGQTKIGEKYFK